MLFISAMSPSVLCAWTSLFLNRFIYYYISFMQASVAVNPRSLEGGGGVKLTPLDFFGFKFLLLYRLSKALAQLFLVCEYIFWH